MRDVSSSQATERVPSTRGANALELARDVRADMADVYVDVRLSPDDLDDALRADAWRGLRSTPKFMPPKWFYDQRGSALFDEITRLPEYYPTRTERTILERAAPEIAARTRADVLVELGSGTSEKTRLLLSALSQVGTLRVFAPFDVSEATLRAASLAIAREYPGVSVRAICGDFDLHLGAFTRGRSRCCAMLGGTIGNYTGPARGRLLRRLHASLDRGDHLLLGADLVKDPRVIVSAYDDASGVTAAFNRNLLAVLNAKLGANFAPERFDHVARWNERERWVEMRLRSREAHVATVRDLGIDVPFGEGEEILTEVSAKFTVDGIAAELEAAGFRGIEVFTDAPRAFALLLARA